MPELYRDHMQGFLGWTNVKMTMEYILSSKAAIITVSQKLQDTKTQDNLAHVNVAGERLQEEIKACR